MADLAPLLSIPLPHLLLALAAVNLATYGLFALDKYQARRGGWRQPEARLLALSALGGAAGGKLAQRHLRHKTRKQPFALLLNLALGWNIVALMGWAAARLA